MLEQHRCQNCKKNTIVSRISPCPKDEIPKLTGMWFTYMDEDFRVHNMGVLCKDCAFRLCDEGKISLGFSGGLIGNLDNWEASKR